MNEFVIVKEQNFSIPVKPDKDWGSYEIHNFPNYHIELVNDKKKKKIIKSIRKMQEKVI